MPSKSDKAKDPNAAPKHASPLVHDPKNRDVLRYWLGSEYTKAPTHAVKAAIAAHKLRTNSRLEWSVYLDILKYLRYGVWYDTGLGSEKIKRFNRRWIVYSYKSPYSIFNSQETMQFSAVCAYNQNNLEAATKICGTVVGNNPALPPNLITCLPTLETIPSPRFLISFAAGNIPANRALVNNVCAAAGVRGYFYNYDNNLYAIWAQEDKLLRAPLMDRDLTWCNP